MKKILVAVDDTKGSVKTVEGLLSLMETHDPSHIILLYVEKIEGRSLMDDLLLSDSEMETLKESLEGTEYKEHLDNKARKIIAYFTGLMTEKGMPPARSLIREGHPAEEILNAAKEEEVDLIAIGSRSSRLHNLFMGSVSREVANNSPVPVLLIK